MPCNPASAPNSRVPVIGCCPGFRGAKQYQLRLYRGGFGQLTTDFNPGYLPETATILHRWRTRTLTINYTAAMHASIAPAQLVETATAYRFNHDGGGYHDETTRDAYPTAVQITRTFTPSHEVYSIAHAWYTDREPFHRNPASYVLTPTQHYEENWANPSTPVPIRIKTRELAGKYPEDSRDVWDEGWAAIDRIDWSIVAPNSFTLMTNVRGDVVPPGGIPTGFQGGYGVNPIPRDPLATNIYWQPGTWQWSVARLGFDPPLLTCLTYWRTTIPLNGSGTNRHVYRCEGTTALRKLINMQPDRIFTRDALEIQHNRLDIPCCNPAP